jgi:UDP-glucose 4-epimerase
MDLKNFLIIGGNGFIGKNLFDYLTLKNFNVTITSRSVAISNKFRIIQLDLNNYYDVLNFFNSSTFDVVIHLSGSTFSSTLPSDYERELNLNLLPSINIFRAFKNSNIKKIVYFSSGGSVYGASSKMKQSEDDVLKPLSPYGLIKKTIEESLQEILIKAKDRYLIIRPSNPYGNYQDPSNIQGIIAKFMFLSFEGKNLPLYGNGNIIRDFIYVEDLVNLTYKLIEMNLNGIFNIGSGYGLSILELVTKIRNIFDMKSDIEFLPSRKTDVIRSTLDIKKLNSYIKYEPLTNIDEGLNKTKNFYNYKK